jgi:Cyclic-phosphate processing Receiver domain
MPIDAVHARPCGRPCSDRSGNVPTRCGNESQRSGASSTRGIDLLVISQQVSVADGVTNYELSLDHDLGIFTSEGERTGYDVLVWIEEKVATHGFQPPPIITVHSANASAAPRMERAISAIYRLADSPGYPPPE